MDLLEACLSHISLVVRAWLGIDLGRSGLCSILLGWHLVLDCTYSTVLVSSVPLFLFYVDQIDYGRQFSSVPEDTSIKLGG